MGRRHLNRHSAGCGGVLVGDATVAHGPELGVFEKDGPGGQAADDDAGAAVEPAATEQVKLQEPQRGMGQKANPTCPLAGVIGIEGGPGCRALLLDDKAVKIECRVVYQSVAKLADAA